MENIKQDIENRNFLVSNWASIIVAPEEGYIMYLSHKKPISISAEEVHLLYSLVTQKEVRKS